MSGCHTDHDPHPAMLVLARLETWTNRPRCRLAPPLAESIVAALPRSLLMRLRLITLVTLCTIAWWAATTSPVSGAEGFVPKTFTGTQGTLPYCLLTPAAPQVGTTYPLVVVLHGAGERGTNNSSQLTHGSSVFLDAKNRSAYPSFVIFPQCPPDKRWVEVDWGDPKPHQMPKDPSVPMSLVLELVPTLMTSLPIDPHRVYVMGLSMGGFGTWDILMRKPEWFAAGVPICGGADNAQAARIATIPLWVWHGGADEVVKTVRARTMVEALKAAGGSPKYTELPGVGHDSWSAAFASPDLLPWLYAQKRP